MNSLSYFERLVATTEMIARHAAYPGKDQAVGQCLEDIDDLRHDGRITPEQQDLLRNILLGRRAHAHAA